MAGETGRGSVSVRCTFDYRFLPIEMLFGAEDARSHAVLVDRVSLMEDFCPPDV